MVKNFTDATTLRKGIGIQNLMTIKLKVLGLENFDYQLNIYDEIPELMSELMELQKLRC